MSTFSNSPIHPTAASAGGAVPAEGASALMPAAPAIRVPPMDDVVIHRFREASPTAAAKLNADFGLSLSQADFLRLQRVARERLMRDITVAELRLLVALETSGRGLPDREAIGELVTDSPLIAETWADMMDKHAALHRGAGTAKSLLSTLTPPCTYADALSLPERYLCRTGRAPSGGTRPTAEEFAVLTAPWQESVAIAAGYRPLSRLLAVDVPAAKGDPTADMSAAKGDLTADVPTAEGVFTLSENTFSVQRTLAVMVRRGGAPRETPARVGDYLLHLPGADLTAVADLLAADREERHPAIEAIRAVADDSYLGTILSLAPAAEVYTAPLLRDTRSRTADRAQTDAVKSSARSTVPARDESAESTATVHTEAALATAEVPAEVALATAEVPVEAPVEAAGMPAGDAGKAGFTVTSTVSATVAQPCRTVAQPCPKTPATGLSEQKNARRCLEVEPLVRRREPRGACADFTLRVSPRHLLRLTEALRARRILAEVVARVTAGDSLRLILHTEDRDIPVALLPVDVLQEAAGVHLHRVTPTVIERPLPALGRPLSARLPGALPGEDGLTPSGREIVALTCMPAPVTLIFPGETDETGARSERRAGMRLHTVTVAVTAPGTGFQAAAAAAAAATRPLREAGIPTSAMRLAVSMTVCGDLAASGGERRSAVLSDAGGAGTLTAEVLCGLYRVAAENGILPADPTFELKPMVSPAVLLWVTAWHAAPTAVFSDSEKRCDDKRFSILGSDACQPDGGHAEGDRAEGNCADSEQDTGNLLDGGHLDTGHANSVEAHEGLTVSGHADGARSVPVCVFPVLRRSQEASLRAVCALLADAAAGTGGVDCRISPVAIRTVTDALDAVDGAPEAVAPAEVAEAVAPAEAAEAVAPVEAAEAVAPVEVAEAVAPVEVAEAVAPVEVAEIIKPEQKAGAGAREVLIPASAAALAARMEAAEMLFFAMSEADAGLLLSDEVIRDAIDRARLAGRRIVVIGEACAAFAAAGLLPSEPAHPVTFPAGRVAEVSYRFSADKATRLIRGALSAPALPAMGEAWLSLRLSDGRTVTDGFESPDKAVLGLLCGMDRTVAKRLVGEMSAGKRSAD